MTIWTPKLVDRTPLFDAKAKRNIYWLIVKADYDEKRDLFSFTVDRTEHAWYRRGMPYFHHRQAAVDWVATHSSYPIGIAS